VSSVLLQRLECFYILRCARLDMEEPDSLSALTRKALSLISVSVSLYSLLSNNSTMALPPPAPLTPRSSPGPVLTDHTIQDCCIDCFTRVSVFISGATWDTLYNIMSVPSEPELRALLTSSIFSNPRTKPTQKLTDTCERIADWLQLHGRHASASRDIIPIALTILLRFRVCNAGKGALFGYGDEVKLVVAIKVAYGNTCDVWMRGSSWKRSTGIDAGVIEKAQILFLETIEWRSWVKEQDFKEFCGRFEVVWDEMLKEEDL
jgi:hypothetical protein